MPADPDRPTSLVLLSTLGVYAASAGVPLVLLASGSTTWAAVRLGLSAGQRLTPSMDGLGLVALLGVIATAVIAPLPTWLLGVRRLPPRTGVVTGATLAGVHGFLVLWSLAAVGLSNLPTLTDTETLEQRLASPHGARNALLYRDDDQCTWTVYESTPLDPVASRVGTQACACDDMGAPSLAWDPSGPRLVDAHGRPFLCTSPRSGCAVVGAPSAMGAMLAAWALFARRRRRATAPSRAA